MADPNKRQALQTELMSLLGGVSGITVACVFEGWKRFLQPDTLRSSVLDAAGFLNAWFIQRKRTKQDNSETVRYVPMGSGLARTHTFEIIGYYNFIEGNITDSVAVQPSEEQFQNIIDNILVVFDSIRSANNLALYVYPMQLDDVLMEFFAGVYCHKAMMHIDMIEWVDGIVPA